MEALTVVETAQLVKLSTRQWWREVKAKRAPAPVYVAEKSPRWLRSTIDEWLRAKLQASASKTGSAA